MDELNLLRRRIQREIAARKAAESIIEVKALELYEANNQLTELNQILETRVLERTRQFAASEKKYRLLVESARDIIYNSDLDGVIIFTNSRVEDILGYSKEEIIGCHFTDFMEPHLQEEIMNHYIDMRDAGVETSYMEIPVLSKEGQTIWLGQNVQRIEHEEGLIFSVVARDITQRKQIEKELELAQKSLSLSEQKYRSMIENMKLGILEVDLNGRVIRAYQGFCEMVEYKPDELIGLNPEDFLLNDRAKDIIAAQHEKREEGIAEIYEIPITTKTGKEKWLLISGAPFYNLNDEVIGSVGIHYDITKQKTLQKELEEARQDAMKAQAAEKLFLANMSHEIRTPLNAIIGMSHLLNDTMLNEEQHEFLNILSTSANLLHSLISDILDISKIDAGHIEIKLLPLHLPDVINNIIQTFSLKAREKGVILESFIDNQTHIYVLADELLLNQILINLVSNAIKFTNEGSIFLRADLMKRSGKNMYIRFEVEDTGIGIPESKLSQVFERFKQVDTNKGTQHSGTGLGLSITKGLVDILGGEITIKSNDGVGSQFTVILPFEEVNASLVPKKEDTRYEALHSFAQCRILVAEDNPMNQKYIGTLMKKWNIQCDIAIDGEEAVQQSRLNTYDLIFMDLQMPKMDGFEATRQILQNSLNESTPVIALTASTFQSKKEMALDVGMVDFLSKPFTPPQLSSIVKKHVNLHTQRPAEQGPVFSFDDNLDRQSLNEIYASDFEYALDMFTIFLEHIDEEMNILKQAVAQQEYQRVKAQAHKMKPTMTMVGLTPLAEQLALIESAAEKTKGPDVHKLHYIFEHMLEDALTLVRRQHDLLSAHLQSKFSHE